MKKWLERLKAKFQGMPRLRKLVIAVIGATVLLYGIALIFLPGPGSIVIPLGLAILATEFAWARRVLRQGRVFIKRARRSANSVRSAVSENISAS